MTTRICALALTMLFAATVGSQARGAILFGFDPDGAGGTAGTFDIRTLDLAPGNALARGAIFGDALAVGDEFELLYQAALVGGLDGAAVFGATDFTGQITSVARFPEVVVLAAGGGGLSLAGFGIGVGDPNYFRLYYNDTVTYDDLAGTGFDDGILIFEGVVTVSQGTFFANANQVQTFDQFGANNHGAQQTITGSGGFTLTTSVTYFDPNFFVSGFDGVDVANFAGSSATPFTLVNPSFEFEFAGVTPNRGPVNGATGPDFQFEADGALSFEAAAVIPEPASIAVFACLGVIGLGGVIRRRRNA